MHSKVVRNLFLKWWHNFPRSADLTEISIEFSVCQYAVQSSKPLLFVESVKPKTIMCVLALAHILVVKDSGEPTSLDVQDSGTLRNKTGFSDKTPSLGASFTVSSRFRRNLGSYIKSSKDKVTVTKSDQNGCVR